MQYNVCMQDPQNLLLVSANCRLAKKLWPGQMGEGELGALRELTRQFGFSVATGQIQLLDGRWYVTHAGLLFLARRNRCCGIRVQHVQECCDPKANRWVFEATIYKSRHSKGFVGYGDANPSNVSPLVRGAEMRVAETRAVNRALRKAYGIGLCSVEELGWSPRTSDDKTSNGNGCGLSENKGQNNGHQNGQPRLRDRLCLLIRQHGLDANLVKAYAADYCGTAALRDASRELVEAFINNLAEWAAKDREGLLCHLNSYAKPEEARK
jgi:hypothetical protein